MNELNKATSTDEIVRQQSEVSAEQSSEITCSRCGKQCKAFWNYCTNCGQELKR